MKRHEMCTKGSGMYGYREDTGNVKDRCCSFDLQSLYKECSHTLRKNKNN